MMIPILIVTFPEREKECYNNRISRPLTHYGSYGWYRVCDKNLLHKSAPRRNRKVAQKSPLGKKKVPTKVRALKNAQS